MKAAAQNVNVNLASFHSQARAESFEHLQRQLKGLTLIQTTKLKRPRENSFLTWDTENTHLRLHR